MRQWTVAGGVIEQADRLLLVQNRRRDGTLDWSTPGGVVDPGEAILQGLTREVEEETGLQVAGWHGPLWEVFVDAPDMGWQLHVEVHRAQSFAGDIVIDDPDGIVIDAEWHDIAACTTNLAASWLPAREPMLAWLDDRWSETRSFRYHLAGETRTTSTITRLDD